MGEAETDGKFKNWVGGLEMSRRKNAIDIDTKKTKDFIKFNGKKPQQISKDLGWSHDYLGQRLRDGYISPDRLHSLSIYFKVNDDFFKRSESQICIPDEVLDPVIEKPDKQTESIKYPEEGTTRVRKGLKMPRLNATFSDENYEYLRVMSTLKGTNMSQYLNILVHKDMVANAEQYELAKELIAEMRRNAMVRR